MLLFMSSSESFGMYVVLCILNFPLIYLMISEAAFISCICPQANSNVAAANIDNVS